MVISNMINSYKPIAYDEGFDKTFSYVKNNYENDLNKLKDKFGFDHKNTIFRKCLTIGEGDFIHISERDHWTYDPQMIEFLKNNRNNVELFGYLEIVPYFHQYKDEIAEIFSPDDASMELIRSTYPILFDETYTTVSIHFRGNEYLSDSYIGQPWDYGFYKRAVDFFKEKFIPAFVRRRKKFHSIYN
jgi:hypothetical protein